MSKGILEQLNDNIVELISLMKAKPDITIEKSDSVMKAAQAMADSVELPAEEPKKVGVTLDAVEVTGGEVEVKEEPKAEEPESNISDDELTKAVRVAFKEKGLSTNDIKSYLIEKSVNKVNELAQADRQGFLDHLAGL